MLKNKILLLVLLLFSFPLAWGQRTDVREEVYADPQRSYGNDFPYPAETCRPTPPPRGYKPFYISHYGRHGSRYYWEASLYSCGGGEFDGWAFRTSDATAKSG